MILLAQIGRRSSSCCTCHINIQYFFVQDRLNSKELSIQHCPTYKMHSDYFTKHVQGALFQKFCDDIMNHHDSEATRESNNLITVNTFRSKYMTQCTNRSHAEVYRSHPDTKHLQSCLSFSTYSAKT